MLNIQEQKYCVIMLLALIIIAVAHYQSYEMSRKATTTITMPTYEGFQDNNQNLLSPSQIITNGSNLDSIRAIQKIKYPSYHDTNAEFPVTATSLLEKQKMEIGKINTGLQVEFVQALQDAEIKTLKSRLEQVIKEGKEKGVIEDGNKSKGKNNVDDLKIKHMASGAVFSTIFSGRGGGFGVILDSNKGTCIQYINNASQDGQNIAVTGCDYDPSVKSQRFRLKKITNNNKFNRALHPDYTMYAITEYNTLNMYPYYIVTPIDSDGLMCITIDDNGVSIEPCTNKYSQRFTVVT